MVSILHNLGFSLRKIKHPGSMAHYLNLIHMPLFFQSLLHHRQISRLSRSRATASVWSGKSWASSSSNSNKWGRECTGAAATTEITGPAPRRVSHGIPRRLRRLCQSQSSSLRWHRSRVSTVKVLIGYYYISRHRHTCLYYMDGSEVYRVGQNEW